MIFGDSPGAAPRESPYGVGLSAQWESGRSTWLSEVDGRRSRVMWERIMYVLTARTRWRYWWMRRYLCEGCGEPKSIGAHGYVCVYGAGI